MVENSQMQLVRAIFGVTMGGGFNLEQGLSYLVICYVKRFPMTVDSNYVIGVNNYA